jgi:hypothetical protein
LIETRSRIGVTSRAAFSRLHWALTPGGKEATRSSARAERVPAGVSVSTAMRMGQLYRQAGGDADMTNNLSNEGLARAFERTVRRALGVSPTVTAGKRSQMALAFAR